MDETVSMPVVNVAFLGYASGEGIEFTGLSVTADPDLFDAAGLARVLPQLLATAAVNSANPGKYVDLSGLGL